MEPEYKSRNGDGEDDPDISFDDEMLNNPSGYDPTQGTLPGVEPLDPAAFLTEQMREELTSAMTDAPQQEAESDADDIDPPSYLGDSAREYMDELWDGFDDSERFDRARYYDMHYIPTEPDEEDAQSQMVLGSQRRSAAGGGAQPRSEVDLEGRRFRTRQGVVAGQGLVWRARSQRSGSDDALRQICRERIPCLSQSPNEFFYIRQGRQQVGLRSAHADHQRGRLQDRREGHELIRAKNRAKWQAELEKQRMAQREVAKAARPAEPVGAHQGAVAGVAEGMGREQASRVPAGGPDGGEFGSGGGDEAGRTDTGKGTSSSSPHAKDATSASSLLRVNKDITIDDLHKMVPGSEEQSMMARAAGQQGDGQDLQVAERALGTGPDSVQRAIINKLMTPEQIAAAHPPPGERPTLYILGGRGGSGKGWFTNQRARWPGGEARGLHQQ
jgi:hypothetical protein